MIVLVTGRRLLMLHGPANPPNNSRNGGGGGGGAGRAQHTYCLVEWEVEFSLFVWLETQTQGERQERRGSDGLTPDRANAYSELRGPECGVAGNRVGGGRGEGGEGEGVDGEGTAVLVYHFPDVFASAVGRSNGDASDAGMGERTFTTQLH